MGYTLSALADLYVRTLHILSILGLRPDPSGYSWREQSWRDECPYLVCEGHGSDPPASVARKDDTVRRPGKYMQSGTIGFVADEFLE